MSFIHHSCPVCSGKTRRHHEGKHVLYVCEGCGWGKERLAQVQAGKDLKPPSEAPPDNLNLAVYWIGTVLFLGGVIYGYVYLGAETDVENFGLIYWSVAGAYLVVANMLTPRYDKGDLGLFGGLIDNPLSFSDDFNRFMLFLAILFLPGKLVWSALRGTWRRLKDG